MKIKILNEKFLYFFLMITNLNVRLIVNFCIGRCVINKMPFTLGYKISYITVISTEALKLFRRISFFLSRFLDILMVFLNLATLGSKTPSKCLETSREKTKSRLNNFISRLSTNNSDINSYCAYLHFSRWIISHYNAMGN